MAVRRPTRPELFTKPSPEPPPKPSEEREAPEEVTVRLTRVARELEQIEAIAFGNTHAVDNAEDALRLIFEKARAVRTALRESEEE